MSFPNQSRRAFLGGLAGLVAASLSLPAFAQSRERVKFQKGNDNAYVEGSIRGDGYHDYILGAKKGQRMGVSLISEQAYFNILPPGSAGEAIYNSSTNGNDATNVVLPATGDYTIRVYQMGAAADGGVKTSYGLSVSIM
jgi:hypothetical protein